MKRRRPTVFAFALCIAAAAAPARAAMPASAWERRLDSESFEYGYRAAAVAPKDGALWVALGARPKGRLAGPEALSLWKISADGKSVREVSVPGAHAAADTTLPVFSDVAVSKGAVLLLTQPRAGTASLSAFEAASGEVLWSREVAFAASAPFVAARLVVLTDGTPMLLGHAAGRPVVAKLEASGEIAWQRSIERDDLGTPVDGVAAEDGGLVMVGHRREAAKAAETWVAKLGPDGKVLRTMGFAGAMGSIARSAEGYAVVYGVPAGGAALAIRVRGLDADLKRLWDNEIRSAVRFLPLVAPYRIAPAPGGDFFVTGLDDGKAGVVRVHRDGRVAWTHTHDEAGVSWQRARSSALAVSDSAAFVLFTMVTVGQNGEQREAVRVARLAAR